MLIILIHSRSPHNTTSTANVKLISGGNRKLKLIGLAVDQSSRYPLTITSEIYRLAYAFQSKIVKEKLANQFDVDNRSNARLKPAAKGGDNRRFIQLFRHKAS